MKTILFYFFVVFNLTVSLGQAEEIPVGSGTGTFQLSLSGNKLGSDQWNTSYHLERSSSKTTNNWNFFLHQNVTDHGNVQNVELRGYFTDNIRSPETGGSSPIALGEILLNSLKNDSQLTDSSEECKETTLSKVPQMKIILRSDWGARNGTASLSSLKHPVIKLDIYHENSECSTNEDCLVAVKRLQDLGISTWGEIIGNFHAGGDGRIYEGLGWNRSFDDQLNLKYLTKGSNPPSPQQFASMALLVHEGIKVGMISKNYSLQGDRSELTRNWIDWVKNI